MAKRSVPHPRLAANVVALRDRCGLLTSELARRSRVPLSTLTRLLNGEGDCTFQTVAALANALGCPLDALVWPERELQAYLCQPAEAVRFGWSSGRALDLRLLSADGRCKLPGDADHEADSSHRTYRLQGDCLSPVLRDGWLLYSPRDAQPVPGQPVLAVMRCGDCWLRELTFVRPQSLVLTGLRDHGDRMTLERAEVRSLQPITGTLYAVAP